MAIGLYSVATIMPMQAHGDANSVVHPYAFDATREWTIMSTGLGLGAIGTYYNLHKTRYQMRDDGTQQRSSVPLFDRGAAGLWNARAAHESDGWLMATALAPLSLYTPLTQDTLSIVYLYTETFTLIAGGVAFAKGVVDRYRPYSYDTHPPSDVRYDADTKRSFFSGHAAAITGSAVFTATLFQDYFPDSVYAPWVWAGTLSVAAYAGSLRVVAGMHFPSDVLLGMLYGGVIAYAIPALHKKRHTPAVAFYANHERFGMTWHRQLH
ncbi:MAG: phosphatase PAP2 family protein [Pseudomonadota bacterium]